MDKRLPRKPRWRVAPAWLETIRFQAIERVNERLIQDAKEVL